MQKIRNISLSLLAVAALASSCKDKSAFKVSGELENANDIKKVYLLAADSVQLNVIDSVNLDGQHKFTFKHQAPAANLYKIKAGDSYFDIIAQNGDEIGIKANMADSTHAYEVSGSVESERIKKFNEISNLYGGKNSKLVEAYQAEAKKLGRDSDSLLNVYMPEFQKNINAFGDEALKFVSENKNSLASFYAITSLDQMKYEGEMVKYADEVSADIKQNPSVQQFIKHMERVKPVSVGQKAPDFTLIDDQDQEFKLSDYKGKYVMIDFWASWCGPCRQENPNIVKLYNEYKNKGLNILGISLDEDLKAWQKAIKDDKLTWRHATEAQRFDGKVVKNYQIEAIPASFIIDPDGKIVAKNLRGSDLEEFLKKTFTVVN